MSVFNKIKQMVCFHDWRYRERFVHGESHGFELYTRYCKRCNQKQVKEYIMYGDIRYKWATIKKVD